MSVEERLLKIIKNSGLTQKKFAESIGVTNSNISNWINPNYQSKPSFDALNRICEKHFINLNWLITGEGNMFMGEDEACKPKGDKSKKEEVSDTYRKQLEEELKKAQEELVRLRERNSKLREENQELNEEIKERFREIIGLQGKLLGSK